MHHHLLKQLCQQAYWFSLTHDFAMTKESLDLKIKVVYGIIKDFQDFFMGLKLHPLFSKLLSFINYNTTLWCIWWLDQAQASS